MAQPQRSSKSAPRNERYSVEFWPFQMQAWNSTRKVIALVGGTGAGKCMSPDSVVTLGNGARATAGALVETWFELPVSTMSGVISAPAMAAWADVETVYTITTDSGRAITRNAGHPLYAATAGRLNGRTPDLRVMGYEPVSQLKVGDLLASVKQLPLRGTLNLSDDVIRFLAYIIGDGGVTGSTPTFTQLDGKQLNEMREVCAALGLEIRREKSDPITYRVVGIDAQRGGSPGSNPAINLLREHGVMGCHSRDKRIPPTIFELDDRGIALFLSRLYATDGWASDREIGYASASEALIRDTQDLLTRLGVCSRIDAKSRTNSWTLLLCGGLDRIAFGERIGIYGKEAALDKVVAQAHQQSKYQTWRGLHLPDWLRWERITSIESRGIERTVAIHVPGWNTYLTTHLEHNTWFAPHWVHKKLTDAPEIRGIAVGTGYETHVVRVMVREMTEYLNKIGEPFTHNKRERCITLSRNGSQLLFGSSDNPLSLEGPHVDFGWLDEAGLMPRMAFDVIHRRTAHKAGQILVTTIPYFDGWLKSDVYDAWVAGDPDIDWIRCKTSDNKTYPQESIDRFKRMWSPAKFKRFFEGDWSTVEGLIFPEPHDDKLLVEPFAIPPDWPAFAGHDFGHNAPTTGVWGRLDPDDVLYIVAAYEASGMSIDDHVYRWRRAGLTNVDGAFGDPANPEVWMRATDIGYPVEKANNSVGAGIDAVYARLVTGRLKILRNEATRDLIDYRHKYVWDTSPNDDNVLLDRPRKPQTAEHVMDGLRYLVMGIQQYGLSAPEPFVMSHHRTAYGV